MIKYKILGITLARGGSKSIPHKNIYPLNNLPLIAYTFNEVKKSKLISDYIVSSDSKKIIDICKKYKVDAPFKRPKKYSSDRSSSASALIHAVKFQEKKYGIKYDFVVELMATNPLKNYLDIDNCIKKLIKTKADSVIAVHKLEDHHPARIKKIVDDKIVNFCVKESKESRRQDLKPDAYVRSGAIYALKRDYLIKKKERHGSKNSRPYILPASRSINIDTMSDLLTAEHFLKKF
ncbi:acylneuraminate cytidylyltransferase family protein [Acinetobacter sp.]|uniref:acylneuraminate cytidylyltransferase family protein n=1 Tax=Acinetobacter sp. TaxID=472 RepID=UPI000C6619BD|nr:acylneuraminate cytidylyltransferase family protein [Acinetobacter sp.]MBC70005.1 cytidylyltransferase [Acinetobacter sp.]